MADSVNPVDANGSESQEANQEVVSKETRDVVDYASHRKLLDEKKKEQARAADLEARLNAIEETKLKEQAKYKELFDARDSELNQLKEQLKASEMEKATQAKMEAFLNAVGGLKDPSYRKMVDLDKVDLEDAKSLEAYAVQFKSSFPDLLAVKQVPSQLPNQGAGGVKEVNLSSLSSEELLALLKRK